MKPAAVTESLLHDLVMSSAAEGTGQTAVAAAVTLGERILLCGHDTRDFDREWDLPGGMPLPGETLTSALSRILACDYGLDATEFGAYLGSHDIVHDGEIIRTFVFTATCADPAQICQHARTAHCWADPADLPEQASQDLARLADIAMLAAAAPSSSPPGQCQVTAALRAWSKGHLLRRSRHRTAHQAPDLAAQERLHHAVHHHPDRAVRDHHRRHQLGRGHHRPAGRKPALLRRRSLHPPPGRQPRQHITRHPARRHHRTRPGQHPPRPQRDQERRRTELAASPSSPPSSEVQRIGEFLDAAGPG